MSESFFRFENTKIQIDGKEIPILDGSSKYFIECLEKCGLKTQDAARKYIEISHNKTTLVRKKVLEWFHNT